MNRTALLSVLPLVFSSSAVFAAATDEGATHLTDVFQSYLGTTEGMVTVEVDGDAYTLTIDPASLAKMASDMGGSATMSPLVYSLTDNGDGTWDVSQDQAVSMAFSMPGQADVKEDIASIKMDGVFDETLQSFSSAKGEMSDVKVSETLTDPKQGAMTIGASMASGTFEVAGQAGAAGGVDSTFSVTFNTFAESFTTPAQDGMPAMPISLTADSLGETGKLDGLRPDALYGTIAWFVAHPTTESKDADKATLKGILQAGIPFFSNLTADVSLKKLAVGTPMGNVGIDEMKVTVDANGVVADGKVREAFSISGLTLPAGIVPDWAAPILPQTASFDFQVTDFDAAAAVNVALGALDLPAGTQPDAAFQGKLMEAFMPDKTVIIGLNPGSIAGDGYALTYTGSMVAGPEMSIPTGKATITLTGIDKLQAALNNAPDAMKAQAMMGVGMAQGMAKQGDNGSLVWEIDASTPGSVLVNGTPVMGGN